eukprot:3177581-Alexandrium_andersonii.AAC.1
MPSHGRVFVVRPLRRRCVSKHDASLLGLVCVCVGAVSSGRPPGVGGGSRRRFWVRGAGAGEVGGVEAFKVLAFA